MKKLLLVVAVFVFFGISSCKKDQGVQPQTTSTSKVLDKKDTTQWD
ncbi:MAG: hypothetical protein H7096_01795 [Flavobacterium sp.]|nr:hypothetical protein [Pedobacter sp.]